jgi:hypothetical protein
MQAMHSSFHLHGTLRDACGPHDLTWERSETGSAKLILLKSKLFRLNLWNGNFPVSGASFSTCRHISGEGKFTTHSEWCARLSAVFVSSKSPSIMFHPNAQKEDIGAMFVEPSSFNELMRATGVPKYRMFGSIDFIMGSVICLSSFDALIYSRHSQKKHL